MNESPSAVVPVEDPDVPRVRKRDLAAAFLKEAGVILARSAVKTVSRTLGWGATGLFVGVLMTLSWWAAGVYPEVTWQAALWIVLSIVGVTGGLGYVGWMRGLGRAAIYVGCERGMVQYLVGALLDRVTALMRKSTRVSSAMEKSSTKLANLPLQQWEEWLTQVAEDYLGSDDPELGPPTGVYGRVTAVFRGFLVSRVRRYLLAIVRKEIAADGTGGGVSIARVRKVGLELCDEKVTDMVEGVMQTHLLIGLAATTVWFILPFGLAGFALW